MQTIHTQPAMAYGADTLSDLRIMPRSAVHAQGTSDRGDASLPSGWWLLPSVVLGSGIWVWLIASLIG